MPQHILVIEDDVSIADVIEDHLGDAGYHVTTVHDGAAGLEQATSGLYDLIILDLMLPGGNGLDICARVRTLPDAVPILMLTCKSSELDRVLGLEIGADDYMTKPFSIRELEARIRALLRRVQGMSARPETGAEDAMKLSDLEIYPAKRLVTLRGSEIHLTAKEYDLLLQFARHPGRVYTRAQLLDLVWGYAYEGYEHTVNSHINRLRSKIETDPTNPDYIRTVWGVGYKMAENVA